MGSNLSVKATEAVRTAEKEKSEDLILKDCSLNAFPKELIKKFKTIKRLDLSTNFLPDIPKQIKELKSLEVLKLGNNDILELPNEVLEMESLTYINVARNQLSKFPEPINRLSNLQKLDFSGNKFKELPAGLGELSLTTFKYGNSNISEIPDVIYNIKTLTALYLQGNRLDTLPERLFELSQLKILNIENNPLTQLPEVITKLTQLEYLNASHTSISDIESYRFDKLTELRSLVLSSCRISKFSVHISGCPKLELLDLSVNLLKTVPREIGHTYRSLKQLYLNENQLQTLPGEINMLDPNILIKLHGNPLDFPFDSWTESVMSLFEALMPYCIAYGTSCSCEGESLENAQASKGTSFFIIARDFLGRKRITGGDKVQVRIIRESELGESPYECEAIVKDHKNGRYEIFFNPQKVGKYRVEVVCNERALKNSPFNLNVK